MLGHEEWQWTQQGQNNFKKAELEDSPTLTSRFTTKLHINQERVTLPRVQTQTC